MTGNTDSEKISAIRADMIEVKMAIMGSEKLGVNGLIQKVDRNTKYIEQDKKLKYRIAGAGSVIIFILTFLKIFWNKISNLFG